MTRDTGSVFSYNLRYIVGFGLVEMAISTNQKPTIYRSLYENTGPAVSHTGSAIKVLTRMAGDESRINGDNCLGVASIFCRDWVTVRMVDPLIRTPIRRHNTCALTRKWFLVKTAVLDLLNAKNNYLSTCFLGWPINYTVRMTQYTNVIAHTFMSLCV